jgi:hypothetical protein
MSNDPQNDDGNLYDDLYDVKPAAAATEALSAVSASSKNLLSSATPLSLVDQLKYLEQKVISLEKENLQLKRNIGTLFRTAKREIQRKDNQIIRVMQDMDDIKNNS